MNWQTCENLVKWLDALQAKLQTHMCHIENHHVSLWMMPHRNFEHCGRLYVFLIYCCIVLRFGTMLTWEFHNIFIVHGKHIDVGCTITRLCGVEILS